MATLVQINTNKQCYWILQDGKKDPHAGGNSGSTSPSCPSGQGSSYSASVWIRMQSAGTREGESSMDFCHHSTSSTSTLMQAMTSIAIHGSLEDRTY